MRSLTPYIQRSAEEARVGQRLVLEPHGSDVSTVALGGQGQLWSRIALKAAGQPSGPTEEVKYLHLLCLALYFYSFFFFLLLLFSPESHIATSSHRIQSPQGL